MYPAANLLGRHPGGFRGPSFRGTSGHPPNAALKVLEKSGAAQDWGPDLRQGDGRGNFSIFENLLAWLEILRRRDTCSQGRESVIMPTWSRG
jgi:hypothetical protein